VAYLKPNQAGATQLTNGPADLFPTFAPDGRRFAFVNMKEGAIVSCALESDKASSCETIHVDPLGPRFTRLSPDGRTLAYQTTHSSASRLRVLSLATRQVADLGVYRSVCPPRWSSNSALWTREKDGSVWKEVDATNGRPTGRTSPVKDDATNWMCNGAPTPEGRTYAGLSLRRHERRSTEIRLARNF
jgi:dipeptidyl aminopeptidase/acylaminoacyl peptidase